MACTSTWFGQPPEVLAAVNPFFLLIGLSLLPVLAYLALRQFAESMGRPWVPVLIILGGVALNAALNWVFIYGHLGMPRARADGRRDLHAHLADAGLRRDLRLAPAGPGDAQRVAAALVRAHLPGQRCGGCSSVGLPASGCLLFEGGAFAAATVMMGWLGAVALAAHQIAIICAALTFMVALGISMAVGMRTSAAVGAGEHSRLRPIWVGGAGMGAALGRRR